LSVSIQARVASSSRQNDHSKVIRAYVAAKSVAALVGTSAAIGHMHRHEDQQFLLIRMGEKVENSASHLLRGPRLDLDGDRSRHRPVDPSRPACAMADFDRGSPVNKSGAYRRPENLLTVRVVRTHAVGLRLTLSISGGAQRRPLHAVVRRMTFRHAGLMF
jgi:hypothetical protein